MQIALMVSGYIHAAAGCASLGVLACTGWACVRSSRHRMRGNVKEMAGELHARALRARTKAQDAMSCIQWIGALPDVEAAAVRSELREVRSLAARAGGISRAAAEVLELSARTGWKDRARLNALHAEVQAYERRLFAIEGALQDRHVLLAHARSLLARHGSRGPDVPAGSAASEVQAAKACMA